MLHIHHDICNHHITADQEEQMNNPNKKKNRKIIEDS